MNEKAAKRLRRQVKNDPEAQKLPVVNYDRSVKRTRRLRLDGLDNGGNVVYVTWPSVTITLGNCQRGLYQRVKRAVGK